MGLVAPWHVGSSRTRAQTRVPCIGRRILNHCATREAQHFVSKGLALNISVEPASWSSVLYLFWRSAHSHTRHGAPRLMSLTGPPAQGSEGPHSPCNNWSQDMVPWTSLGITWELFRNADSQSPPRPPGSETLVVGPHNLCFNRPRGWFYAHPGLRTTELDGFQHHPRSLWLVMVSTVTVGRLLLEKRLGLFATSLPGLF